MTGVAVRQTAKCLRRRPVVAMPNPQKILLIDDDATMAGPREPCAVSVGRKDVTGSEVGGSIGMGVSPMGLETSGSESRACTDWKARASASMKP